MSPKDFIYLQLQRVFSLHILSQILGFFSHWENETWKNLLIKKFGRHYKINTKEAVTRNLKRYPNFNAFYTRPLKPEVRPVTEVENSVACPVDGMVSQLGAIGEGQIIQAKGKNFSVSALLGGENKYLDAFNGGNFITFMLSPKDYHRVHMPIDGTLKETIHIPGCLFPVNMKNIASMSDLYAKNERVVCIFDSKAGEMGLVFVGSIFSSSIETIWDGVITPPTQKEIRRWNYPFNPPVAKKGQEIGRFNIGSTVILLFSPNAVHWEDNIMADHAAKMGELIGKTLP